MILKASPSESVLYSSLKTGHLENQLNHSNSSTPHNWILKHACVQYVCTHVWRCVPTTVALSLGLNAFQKGPVMKCACHNVLLFVCPLKADTRHKMLPPLLQQMLIHHDDKCHHLCHFHSLICTTLCFTSPNAWIEPRPAPQKSPFTSGRWPGERRTFPLSEYRVSPDPVCS